MTDHDQREIARLRAKIDELIDELFRQRELVRRLSA